MATKKPAKKQNLDLRLYEDWYIDEKNSNIEDLYTKFTGKLSVGGVMDFRILTKKVNQKIADALAMMSPSAHVTTQDKTRHVCVHIWIDSISYTKDGLVYRYLVEVDNRYAGEHSKYFVTDVDEPRCGCWRCYCTKPTTVADMLNTVNNKLYGMLEDVFNETLYKSGLAPSDDSRWNEENY